MARLFEKFLRCKSGTTAMEYAFIASLISVTIIAASTAIGLSVGDSFNEVSNGFE